MIMKHLEPENIYLSKTIFVYTIDVPMTLLICFIYNKLLQQLC